MRYWLVKSEPDVFGIDHLAKMPKQTEHWDGVRNYQARNFMRDEMKVGDQVLFYHSNCKEPGVVGITEVVREGYVDHTQFDPDGKYFDSRSKPENPRWFMVDLKLVRRLKRNVTLQEMKAIPELADCRLVQKGNRLSVMPLEKEHFETIVAQEGS